MTELRPGLHRIEAPLGERFVALYLLVGREAALLVDTGIRESVTDVLLPYLKRTGIDRHSIRWAVNTHCDFDHTGGNGALRAAVPDVQIVAHRLDTALTEDLQLLIDERYGEFRDSDGFDDPPETTAYLRSVSDLVPVDNVVAGTEVFDLGDRVVRLLHVPGHSPGHLAVYDESNRALLIGDATLGSGVLTARGEPAFPPTYRDVDPYLASLRAFRDLDVDLLLTAHYPVYRGAAVARFLTESEDYTAHIDRVISAELAGRTTPATTLELVRAAGSALGAWSSAATDYAVFPVTGNLERMERAGLVSQDRQDGRRRWRWLGTQ
ncbi:MBL fold metallo-hydrolase [Cryobacterium soli]|jgi:glyoxylase-like metal-dependent hydrolase (beta-lactamase superfamily II)|uniref:MBL fold metallo-hydrolase n=1 Tax=Cryobacterium soli TaxID=2220095 RepID=UPI0013C3F3F5|nr:MBL fold metallo-hydrolase [Cryobacterium soli]